MKLLNLPHLPLKAPICVCRRIWMAKNRLCFMFIRQKHYPKIAFKREKSWLERYKRIWMKTVTELKRLLAYAACFSVGSAKYKWIFINQLLTRPHHSVLQTFYYEYVRLGTLDQQACYRQTAFVCSVPLYLHTLPRCSSVLCLSSGLQLSPLPFLLVMQQFVGVSNVSC